jgi:hypothetical protein
MAFETGSRMSHRGESSSKVLAEPALSEATSLEVEAAPSAGTLDDVEEVIRAHYRAMAHLIQVVYLRGTDN